MFFVFEIALLIVLAWALRRELLTQWHRLRLRYLIYWLNMDKVSVARKAQDGDAYGIARDIAREFRERSYLHMFRIERALEKLSSEQFSDDEREGMLEMIAHTRARLDEAEEYEVWGFTFTCTGTLSEEARRLLRPLAIEAYWFRKQAAFFNTWLAKLGIEVLHVEGTL